MSTAVFLDRDNTLIHNDDDLGNPDDVDLIQGAASAIGSLCGLGYKVVVVTNQGGVARGRFTEQDVDQVHARIRELVRANSTGADVERFYYCPYHPKGTVKKYKRDHAWRKPRPGMLLQAAKDMDLDLSQCWMIGDKLRDVRAGATAGTRTILLRDPKKNASADDDDGGGGAVVPDFVAVNLIAAVRIVAQQRHPESADQIGAEEPASKRWSAAAAAAMKRKPPDTSALTTTIRAVEPPAPKAAKSAATTRPFRPWNAPSAPQTPAPQTPAPPKHATKAVAPANPAAAPEAEPKKKPADEPQPPADNLTLRQILQELRNQRSSGSDFSYLSMLAIVLQMVVLVCLLAAFFLGGNDQDSFIRWISTAVLIQLATIATLRFGR